MNRRTRASGSVSPRGAGAAAFLALAAGASLAWASTIEGQIFDRDGKPLAGAVVRVVETAGGGFLPSASGPAEGREVARVAADRHGFFKFDLGPRTIRGPVLVRCHDDANWDRLRYATPPDKDVAAALRGRGRAVVACLVGDAPGWAALSREIARVGGSESDRGRVLRRMGLPPETFVGKDGQVEWRYPGAVYAFRDGILVTAKETAGRTPPAEAADRPETGK
jgi:hypothetical protein